MKKKAIAAGIAAGLCSSAANIALADDWSVSGLIRQEIGVKTTSDQNINNQQGNPYNGVTVPSTGLFGGAFTRPASFSKKSDYNLFSTRLEVNLDGKLTDRWSAHFKLRGISDQIGRVDKAYEGQNMFEQNFTGSKRGTPLENNGKDWMLDLPAAYVDYASGPLWLRLGNQQIAWGETLFFRVADVPNGLDLRRHAILGVAAEEYADARVPSLGLRGSYRVDDAWEAEGFLQKFQPTILPGQNSPYNGIPAQFTVHDQEGYDDVKNKWNIGARVRGKLGGFGVQAFAVRRYNPDGVYKWTDSKAGPLAGTPFEAGTTTGVYSAAEWFKFASNTRLDGIGALGAIFKDFGTAAMLGGPVAAGCAQVPTNTTASLQASCTLDTLFTAMGDLRGHIRRDFPKEDVIGFSLNHVFEGEPDTLLDQLIGRFEMSHTPNKRFTSPTLSKDYIVKDENQYAFIFEKYHKFSSDVPATYMVAQWLHKSASDIFGRALEGLDNTPGTEPKGRSHGFDAVAFSVQQPSPTLAWRFDLTALTDLRGGWLIQPGVRWKPSREFQLDIYANVLKSYGDQNYRNFTQGFENANELFVRGTYSF